MNNILADNTELFKDIIIEHIIQLIKGSKDSISMEETIWAEWTRIFCEWIAAALEAIDAELYRQVYKPQGWQVSRRDERTVCCLFGTLTYKRRRLEKEGKTGFYPLDRKLGFEPRSHYSLALVDRIVRASEMTTFRHVSSLVGFFTQVSVSAQTADKLMHYAGRKSKEFEEAEAAAEQGEKRIPEGGILAVEGDGVVMKMQKDWKSGERGGQKEEFHRIQIYEGVERNGKRTKLINCHSFSGINRQDTIRIVREYLHTHYELSEITILSNGDGGAGYNFNDFEKMTEGCRRHEHFRDRYHANEKIRTRLSFCDGKFVDEFIRAIDNSRDVVKEMTGWLDTAESMAETPEDIEQVARLASYLKRHAPYIPGIKERGIETSIRLGTAESGHRYYSYRLKRQGRCWTAEGLECMGVLMTATRNGNLAKALLYKASGQNFKKMDRAMHKAAAQAAKKLQKSRERAAWKRRAQNYRPGCIEGRIAVYGPSSSPMGQLALAIQNW